MRAFVIIAAATIGAMSPWAFDESASACFGHSDFSVVAGARLAGGCDETCRAGGPGSSPLDSAALLSELRSFALLGLSMAALALPRRRRA